MKKIMILVLITFLTGFLAACGTKAENTSSEPEVFAQIIPEPASNNSCEWECGTYYSDISVSAIKSYLQELKKAGWEDVEGNELSVEVQKGTTQYMLTKGSSILQIMMILNDINEGIYNNSVLVKLDNNLPVSYITSRMGAIQKNEALKKIQPAVDSMAQTDEFVAARKDIIGLFEVFMEDAYEKSNIQAFSAISDHGFTGCFLLCNNSVVYVPGGLDNTCVADIDKDDNYELLVLNQTYHSDIYAMDLYAYKYYTPAFSSSSVKGLHVAYQNRFVPKFGYPELSFKKLSDTEVTLVSTNTDYGILKIDGTSLVVENTRAFPFKQWSDTYDQDKLIKLHKEIPKDPPPINISIGGQNLDYIVQTTQWNGTENKNDNAYGEIMRRNYSIPTFTINDKGIKSVRVDFGDCIPDSIKVSDSMLDNNGNNRYTDKEIMDRAVKIIDNSRVEFQLEQHIAYYLSSNMEDYKKDWYRLFKITCVWGKNECEYSFLINTRNTWE
ncbi:MAG: hypothetical protein BWY74_03892 [Firmicutes bacterium ADurb.Bin419]|nr:MAG: hypothetical protein BWY74_03892 [Firmicutes bacterium ADurb.Bin419]